LKTLAAAALASAVVVSAQPIAEFPLPKAIRGFPIAKLPAILANRKDALKNEAIRIAVHDHLASGTFGDVHSCQLLGKNRGLFVNKLKSKEDHVVKFVDVSNPYNKALFRKELDINSKIPRHPAIVSAVAFGFIRPLSVKSLVGLASRDTTALAQAEKAHLVMEKATGGELLNHVSAGTVSQRHHQIAIRVQLIAAIYHLHSVNIVYRDMKPENAWYDLSTKKLKVMDFGLSAIIPQGQKRNSFTGTPGYMAPEVANHDGHDRSVDIWQLAVMMVVVAARWNPFHDDVNIYAPVRAYQNPETFFKYLNTDEGTSFWKLIQFFWKPIQNLESGQGVSQYFQKQFLLKCLDQVRMNSSAI
jgi:serine/threonine protein kinase